MNKAVDLLIKAALDSDDPALRELGKAANRELYGKRKSGRPPKLSDEDTYATFVVWDGLYARLDNGSPTTDTIDAIAEQLMRIFSVKSRTTAREFARRKIDHIGDALEARLREWGVVIDTSGLDRIGRIRKLKGEELKCQKPKKSKL